MERSKLKRLAVAVAAAGLLFGGVGKALSTEISAQTFVTSLQQYVENNEIAAAKDALAQLQAMGITSIKIGDEFFLISDLIVTLDNPDRARVLLAVLSANANRGVGAFFVAEDRVVASVDWTGDDLFPTSSAG